MDLVSLEHWRDIGLFRKSVPWMVPSEDVIDVLRKEVFLHAILTLVNVARR